MKGKPEKKQKAKFESMITGKTKNRNKTSQIMQHTIITNQKRKTDNR